MTHREVEDQLVTRIDMEESLRALPPDLLFVADRISQGFTIEELAAELGVTRVTVRRWKSAIRIALSRNLGEA